MFNLAAVGDGDYRICVNAEDVKNILGRVKMPSPLWN